MTQAIIFLDAATILPNGAGVANEQTCPQTDERRT